MSEGQPADRWSTSYLEGSQLICHSFHWLSGSQLVGRQLTGCQGSPDCQVVNWLSGGQQAVSQSMTRGEKGRRITFFYCISKEMLLNKETLRIYNVYQNRTDVPPTYKQPASHLHASLFNFRFL